MNTPNRPLGPLLPDWSPPPRPESTTIEGTYCRLERLDPAKHAKSLHKAFAGHDWLWDYMPNGPFAAASEYEAWATEIVHDTSIVFYVVQDVATQAYIGLASFLRINPNAGSIEVGYITFSPKLQRTTIATEAMYLMMKWAFEAGYRRYEWKCNALNAPSRRAAQRLGFSYEGVFRQAQIVKGRNRDTAWFAVIDAEWPALRRAYETWLSADNFDADGQQIQRLGALTSSVRAASDPTL